MIGASDLSIEKVERTSVTLSLFYDIKYVKLLMFCRQIFLIRTGNSGGPWQTEWTLRMDDVIGVPTINENKLIFNIKQVAYWSHVQSLAIT